MKKAGMTLGIWFLAFAIWGGGLAGLYFLLWNEDRVQMPIRTEIETAIEVKDLRNEFMFVQDVWLGGAGGGGMGAPKITAFSGQQFAELVPASEPVFVAFEFL